MRVSYQKLCILMCFIVITRSHRALLVKDVRNRRAVHFTGQTDQSCFIYGHPPTVQKLRDGGSMEVRNVNHRQLRQAIEQCHQQYSVSYPVTRTGAFDFIYPGTRWCGPGDVAAHYHDLGFHTEVDACCRAHDHCFDIIPSQSCKHGLCNVSPFTMSHCDCDDQFRSCLSSLSDNVSHAVGLLFFDVGALPCFRPHDSIAQTGQCSNHSATNTRFKRHCDGTVESGMLWEFAPAKSFRTTLEESRSFGGYESGTSSLSQALAKLGDVTTIVRSVVDSTLKTRRVGRKFE